MPILVPQIDATIPDGITDLDAFRRWARSDDYPKQGRFAFLNGNLWMDLSLEMAFSHNQVKGEISAQLMRLVKETEMGHFFTDGMLFSNPAAGFSTIPDGIFVSVECFEDRRVEKFRTDDGDFIELVGSPDMVLEVVSKSSEEKDTVDLLDQYWQAGVTEYWLVDARSDELSFDIFRHGPSAFVATRKAAGGWLKSNIFGRSFRLTRKINRLNDPVFTLESR